MDSSVSSTHVVDDDAAESAKHTGDRNDKRGPKDRKNRRGQNKNRQNIAWSEEVHLCNSRNLHDEFSPSECSFGDKCRLEHDLRRYLDKGRGIDLTTFSGNCPVWEIHKFCPAGWRCRFVKSHSKEIEREDGRKELVLIDGRDQDSRRQDSFFYNVLSPKSRDELSHRKFSFEKSDQYTQWLNTTLSDEIFRRNNNRKLESSNGVGSEPAQSSAKEEVIQTNGSTDEIKPPTVSEQSNGSYCGAPAPNGATYKAEEHKVEGKQDSQASYVEPPFLPSEKRRIYYGPETPVLAPLTTQGNLPFRRLCVDLGAQATFSEMAMGMPLIGGQRGEWALMRAHESEIQPPRVNPDSVTLPADYDNSKDLKYGVQIAANKPWLALKATQVVAEFCPKVRAIDLNCGCPIDMVFKTGAGSALLDQHAKLEKMLRGMNALSGEIPITAKIRMGTKDNNPNADSVVKRLMLGSNDSRDLGLGSCGVAAITLHGRSRQQRYTRSADWEYIADVAALIKRLNEESAAQQDTTLEVDDRYKPNGGQVYFLGNGDCFSYNDYWDGIAASKVDSVMIGRAALIKPWIFEEIAVQQHLDKSASERLAYIEKFVRYGLDTWGSDETGVNTTRRFLLEWLSFTCRYVPAGILEHLPAKMNERPERFRGRNDQETLLASQDSRDWVLISEMFLGRPNAGYKFVPKHKSNSYEAEG
jgi:tRNA-dihydrouridine synthase 3